MSVGGGLDLLREWQSAMQSVIPQAELFERGVKTIREPADLARAAAGLEKRPQKKASGKKA